MVYVGFNGFIAAAVDGGLLVKLKSSIHYDHDLWYVTVVPSLSVLLWEAKVFIYH